MSISRAVITLCLVLAVGAALADAKGPRPPARHCDDRISGAVVIRDGQSTPFAFRVHPKEDTVIGPVAFSGARGYGRSWAPMVARDQWLKSIALVRRGQTVTLEVPAEQRAWMRLEYAHAKGRTAHAVTLEGCRTRPTAAQQRQECGSRPRPDDTCTSGPTPFSGGFTIDYARAPHQGRCAELVVWVKGRSRALRERLFVPASEPCGS
jgi:hypothetical protein